MTLYIGVQLAHESRVNLRSTVEPDYYCEIIKVKHLDKRKSAVLSSMLYRPPRGDV